MDVVIATRLYRQDEEFPEILFYFVVVLGSVYFRQCKTDRTPAADRFYDKDGFYLAKRGKSCH